MENTTNGDISEDIITPDQYNIYVKTLTDYVDKLKNDYYPTKETQIYVSEW